MSTPPHNVKDAPTRATPTTSWDAGHTKAASRHGEETSSEERFISGIIRDEHARYQAQPFFLDGPDWSVAPAQPEPDLSTAPPDLEALRDAWEAEWELRADAERETAVAAAREEAYARGLATARAEHSAEREAERTAFAEDAARLHTLWKDHLENVDPLLIGLAVDVAETVLDGPLGEDIRDATAAAITAAIERLAAQPPLVVTMHPVEQLRLQESGMVDALTAAHPGLRWVPDAGLAEGDWSLDATGAAVRHVRSEVLSDLRRRLGLEQDPTADEAASE